MSSFEYADWLGTYWPHGSLRMELLFAHPHEDDVDSKVLVIHRMLHNLLLDQFVLGGEEIVRFAAHEMNRHVGESAKSDLGILTPHGDISITIALMDHKHRRILSDHGTWHWGRDRVGVNWHRISSFLGDWSVESYHELRGAL